MKSIMKSKQAKLRQHQIQSLLKLYGLSAAHLRAVRHGSHWQPYHNYQHGYLMALAAGEAAIEQGLPHRQIKQVMLAGLYHAYRHTGDYRVEPEVNLQRAYRGARLWLGLHRRGLKGEDRRQILNLIIGVGTPGATPKTAAGRVLSDVVHLADLSAEANLWFEARAREEMLPVTAESVNETLTDVEIYTRWGQDRINAFQRVNNFAPPVLTADELARLEASLIAQATKQAQPSSIDNWLRQQQHTPR